MKYICQLPSIWICCKLYILLENPVATSVLNLLLPHWVVPFTHRISIIYLTSSFESLLKMKLKIAVLCSSHFFLFWDLSYNLCLALLFCIFTILPPSQHSLFYAFQQWQQQPQQQHPQQQHQHSLQKLVRLTLLLSFARKSCKKLQLFLRLDFCIYSIKFVQVKLVSCGQESGWSKRQKKIKDKTESKKKESLPKKGKDKETTFDEERKLSQIPFFFSFIFNWSWKKRRQPYVRNKVLKILNFWQSIASIWIITMQQFNLNWSNTCTFEKFKTNLCHSECVLLI